MPTVKCQLTDRQAMFVRKRRKYEKELLSLCSFATVTIELCRENFGMARKENTKAKEKRRERKLMELKMNLG